MLRLFHSSWAANWVLLGVYLCGISGCEGRLESVDAEGAKVANYWGDYRPETALVGPHGRQIWENLSVYPLGEVSIVVHKTLIDDAVGRFSIEVCRRSGERIYGCKNSMIKFAGGRRLLYQSRLFKETRESSGLESQFLRPSKSVIDEIASLIVIPQSGMALDGYWIGLASEYGADGRKHLSPLLDRIKEEGSLLIIAEYDVLPPYGAKCSLLKAVGDVYKPIGILNLAGEMLQGEESPSTIVRISDNCICGGSLEYCMGMRFPVSLASALNATAERAFCLGMRGIARF